MRTHEELQFAKELADHQAQHTARLEKYKVGAAETFEARGIEASLQREAFKADAARALGQYKLTEANNAASFKAALDFGQQASKGLLLLNGAGALALLAFLGTPRAADLKPDAIALALATFAAGAFGAVLCMAFTYAAQAFYTRQMRCYGGLCQGSAIVVGLGSAGLFLVALCRGASAFSPNFSVLSLFGL